jgi:hypothetical protein
MIWCSRVLYIDITPTDIDVQAIHILDVILSVSLLYVKELAGTIYADALKI